MQQISSISSSNMALTDGWESTSSEVFLSLIDEATSDKWLYTVYQITVCSTARLNDWLYFFCKSGSSVCETTTVSRKKCDSAECHSKWKWTQRVKKALPRAERLKERIREGGGRLRHDNWPIHDPLESVSKPQSIFHGQRNESWGFWFGVISRVKNKNPSWTSSRKSSEGLCAEFAGGGRLLTT